MIVEKNIQRKPHGNRVMDFGKMVVGDSILLSDKKKRYSIFSSLRWYNKKNKTKIKIETRNDGNSVRFWRIK